MLTLALGSASPCTTTGDRLGEECVSSEIEGDEVVLEGSGGATSGGGGGSGSSGQGPSAGTGSGGGTGSGTPWVDPRDEYDVILITLDDIARFRPTPGIQRMEPDGWVVVDLPANIYSIVDRQVVPGELLGQPADVRFTPVAWHWDYGDGTTRTLGTKGGTWAGLGLREFDATPTSHVYRAAGSYTIRLRIGYRAEYRIAGGPFVPIAGTLTLPANELHITAGGAKTVLVDRDCTVAPRGPGC